MSATAFTPGPWQAAPFSSVVGCPITAQPDPKQNTVVIAGVHGAFGDDYRSEVEANAALMAAAPDLHESLTIALGIIGAAGIIWMGEEKARSALRKARASHE